MTSKNLLRVFSLCVSLVVSVSPAFSISEESLKSAIDAVDKLAEQKLAENQGVGIALGVVHKDKLVHARGFGLREAGHGEKVDADTVFQLASVSKPVGATVVAALVGDGKLTWDSKIADLDPRFQMNLPWVTSQITVRDFYAHRSGLPDHAGDLLEDMGYNREQVLHRLRYQRPDSSFRSGYAYTNFGITEAAQAAANTTGNPWEQVSEDRLYKPLGMNSTSSRFSDFIARQNRALNHVPIDGKWVHKYQRQPDAQSPAGGVSSSVNDMAQWLRLQLANGKFEGKQIVDEKALQEAHHPVMLTSFNPFNGLPSFYGLGFNVNYDDHGLLHLGHSGAFELGASTCVLMVPKEEIGIVVLMNTQPNGVAEGLAMSFIDMALYGKPEHDWFSIVGKIMQQMNAEGISPFDYAHRPAGPAPCLPLQAYTGTYTNDLYGDVVISEKNGKLVIAEGPERMQFELQHFDRDTFTYIPPGENGLHTSGIRFNITPDRKATAVWIENLDANGQGTFERVTTSGGK